MIKLASLDLNEDLKLYTQYLRQQGILHRIVEESGKQSVYVSRSSDIDFVKESLRKYLETGPCEELAIEKKRVGKENLIFLILNLTFKSFVSNPATFLLILICVAVAFLTSMGRNTDGASFLFYPLIDPQSFLLLLRDITTISTAFRTTFPMFLHFGELHLVFNMVWLWYFGRQLERIGSTWFFITLVIIFSFVSNTSQYLALGYNNFGGMSGVVYGLLGYTWVCHVFMPKRRLLMSHSIFIFFVISLFIMEFFASSWIATAAHLGGLLSGLVVGLLVVIHSRWSGKAIN